ncbi:hypothetical protein D1869_07900 [Sulfurisphaera ohwakuensis]|uniref:ParB-like N-terminal domain-containing protein n=1 Tax=Sulfurisphaera ohwakuensis TaxID=69656 RepID=A0A650CHF7_SULOH|nr:hypothetical protein D1869_07900 [Sulfurisphaera ohwakuensis]
MIAVNISLEWVSTKDLLPHEDIIPSIVEENVLNIKKKQKIVPIIVDTNTNLILDGHHRYYAFIKLGIRKIPVYYVDYRSSNIIVNTWYRLIYPPLLLSLNVNGEYCVTDKGTKILCDNSLYKLYWRQNMLEQILIKNGYKIIKNFKEGLYIPPLEKEYVISIALKGLRFPPKSTRHEYKFYIAKEEIGINEY